MANIIVSCNRAVRFGARCRGDATANGRCVEHLTVEAPRAPAPDVVLVKFTLPPQVAGVAANLFRDVPRMRDEIEKSHEAVAKAAGLQFKGIRAVEKDDPGDSGTPVFGRPGLKDVTLAPLREELERAGFALANVHTFANKTGKQVLVLGYHIGGEPVALRADQQAFISRSWAMDWGFAHVWANVPEMEACASDGITRFKYLVIEDRGGNLLIQVTNPRGMESAEIAKSEIRYSRMTCLHTVNVGGPSKGFEDILEFADGLWGVM